MMTCSEVESILWTRTRAELEADGDLQLHLARCAPCADAQRDARAVDAALRAAVESEPVRTAEVRRRVIERMNPRETLRPRTAVFRAVAALLLVFAGVAAWIATPPGRSFEAMARRHHLEEVVAGNQQTWVTGPEQIADFIESRIDASPAGARAVLTRKVRAARLCHVGDAASIHLLVEGEGGPVSLFLCREPARQDRLAHGVGVRDELRSAMVAADGLTVVVVGSISDLEAGRMATAVWSDLAT